MDELFFLFKVFIISFSGAVSPGPVTAATLAASTKYKNAGFMVSFGHAIVEVPLILLIVAGASRFLNAAPVQVTVGMLGGLVLFWMAYGLAKDVWLGKNYSSTGKINYKPIRAGALLTLSNPYLVIWWSTIGLNLIMEREAVGAFAVVSFILAHWLSDMVWLEFLSFSTYHGTRAVGDIGRKVLFGVCSAALFVFGGVFIYRSSLSLIDLLNH